MSPVSKPARSLVGNRDGVALPLALIGLVAVTIMITAAIVTSTTELGMSQAYRDGSRALYLAEAGIEQLVSRHAHLGATIDPWDDAQHGLRPGTRAVAVGNHTAFVRISRLAAQDATDADGRLVRTETLSLVTDSVVGTGLRSSRGIGVLLRLTRSGNQFLANINAGATSGGNFSVEGSTIISHTSANCAADTADAAIQVTAGSAIFRSGNATIDGKADTTNIAKAQLQSHVLGTDLTLRQMADRATIKFGPRWNRPAWSTSNKPSSMVNNNNAKPWPSQQAPSERDPLNWGCPAKLDGCGSGTARGDTTYRPSVAIDANGGSVQLTGDHGQGILIIINGNLDITGNFNFDGIILVERDLTIRGTGGTANESKIEGGVVAFGEGSSITDVASGNTTIRFNQCAITAAQQAFNQDAVAFARQSFPQRTFSWFEVVR